MGMFDEITCKMPLPQYPGISCDRTTVFQTKSLKRYMEQYVIQADGKLEHVEENEIRTKPQFAFISFYAVDPKTDNMYAYMAEIRNGYCVDLFKYDRISDKRID